jgi:hypothetical protein
VLLWVIIHKDDFVLKLSKAGTGYQANVTGTNYGYSHMELPVIWKLPLSALIRPIFTADSWFGKTKLPSAVEKLSDSVP